MRSGQKPRTTRFLRSTGCQANVSSFNRTKHQGGSGATPKRAFRTIQAQTHLPASQDSGSLQIRIFITRSGFYGGKFAKANRGEKRGRNHLPSQKLTPCV